MPHEEPQVQIANADLVEDVGLSLVGGQLADDLAASASCALRAGARGLEGEDPNAIFRSGLRRAINKVGRSSGAPLFIRFLKTGPYPYLGDFVADPKGKWMSDGETMKVVRFLCGTVVASFQGFLAEMLAAGPLSGLVADLKRRGTVPPEAILFLGDSVKARTRKGRRARAADAHVLSVMSDGSTTVHVVAEVKSGYVSPGELRQQFDAHVERPGWGIYVQGRDLGPAHVSDTALSVFVSPSTWKLPRSIHFVPTDENRALSSVPPANAAPHELRDQLMVGSIADVDIVLRWSREALAAVAYDMAHWLMGRLGEVIWANQPSPLVEMSSHDAGRNAAKQMLQAAAMRASSKHDWDKAAGLYNTFGFGYALGMNFRAPVERTDGSRTVMREMLFPKDLDEILEVGVTSAGGRIV